VNTSETGSATPSISSSWLASPTFSSTQSPLSPTFDIPSRPSFAAGRPSTSVERPSTSSHPGELRSFGRGDDLASPRSSQHGIILLKSSQRIALTTTLNRLHILQVSRE
jgi:hypothetical protein